MVLLFLINCSKPFVFSVLDCLTVYVYPSGSGTFYIRFEQEEADKIDYLATRNQDDPCESYGLKELKQNGKAVAYDKEPLLWKLVK